MTFYMDFKNLIRQGQTDSELFRNFAAKFEIFIKATNPDPVEFREFPEQAQKRLDVLQPRLEKLRFEARYGGLNKPLKYIIQFRREVLMTKAAVRVVKGFLPILVGVVGLTFMVEAFKNLPNIISRQR